MSQEQFLGIFRAVLTTVGGILVQKGITDEATMTAIVGALVVIGGAAWSIYSNKKSRIVKVAEKIEQQSKD